MGVGDQRMFGGERRQEWKNILPPFILKLGVYSERDAGADLGLAFPLVRLRMLAEESHGRIIHRSDDGAETNGGANPQHRLPCCAAPTANAYVRLSVTTGCEAAQTAERVLTTSAPYLAAPMAKRS